MSGRSGMIEGLTDIDPADAWRRANPTDGIDVELDRVLALPPAEYEAYMAARLIEQALDEEEAAEDELAARLNRPYGYENGRCVECGATNGSHFGNCAAVD